MSNDDFFDFMVFWELMFPEDEEKTLECPSCDRLIKGSEKVPWVDKKNKIFKCPNCKKLLKLNDNTVELIQVEEGFNKEEPKQVYEQSIECKSEEDKKTININCLSCKKSFEYVMDLGELKKSEVGEYIRSKIICPHCGAIIDATTQKTKVTSWNCQYCSQKFSSKEEAEGHEKECKFREESKKIDFPTGQLKSQEKFVCQGNVVFYLDLFTLDLKSKKKNEVIKELVSMFTSTGLVKDGNQYYNDLLYRESLGSTGIGQGVAIPYTSADIEDDLVAGLAISKEGIDFGSLDGQPAHIFFISAFKKRNDPHFAIHLKFLARVSRLIKNPESRQALINAKSREELFQFIKDNFNKENK